MKKTIMTMVLAVLAMAVHAEESPRWATSLELGYATKYVGSNALVFDRKAVTTADFFALHIPSGLYFDAFGVKGHKENGWSSDELDLTVGWGKTLADGLKLDIGTTLVVLDAGHDTHCPKFFSNHIGLSKAVTKGNHTLTLGISAGFRTELEGPNGGIFAATSAEYRYQLDEKTSLYCGVTIAADDGLGSLSPNQYGFGKAGVKYQLTKRIGLKAEIDRSIVFRSNNDRGNGETWGVLSMSYAF
ncbi:MAG: hypothetical protein WCL61_01055 [bacterium]